MFDSLINRFTYDTIMIERFIIYHIGVYNTLNAEYTMYYIIMCI